MSNFKLVCCYLSILSLNLVLSNEGIKKEGGDIHDLFSNEETEFFSDDNLKVRDRLDVDQAHVEQQWVQLEKKLERELEKIRLKGNKVIPETTYEKILKNGGKIPEKIAEKVHKRGVLIVRNTIPEAEMKTMMSDLMKYLYSNNGFPKDPNQTVYEIYWSKPQMRARQHPNLVAVQKSLLGLWHKSEDNEVDVDLDSPLMYVDRLRVRPPGDANFRLPPHVDGGGLERWSDSSYGHVYRNIYDDFNEYDPFEVDYRVQANMNQLGIANGCTFFRAFQGWLSLSHSRPGTGTLRVLPLLKEATAYWILRPFLSDVPNNLFPGCSPGKTFHVSRKWHPKLVDALVSIPEINPGDTVWWHADLIHSVESEHTGTEPNSVFYIPTGPDCPINRSYLRRMRHTFVLGQTPPDFPVNNYEVNFPDRATYENDVTPIGHKTMGWPDVRVDEKVSDQASCNAPLK